ncbi:glycosyltransferase family 2 protein [Phaeovulum sp.]|uniref:glycosyltransferase family 2 protein n=1 Tax=Phaeovulum sp. TaxID=2934796 RepID=UPI0039E3BFD8
MVVTVIIPVFNRPMEIRSAVESVMRQACALPLDILIVDDGSTDETPEVLAALATQDPRIRNIRRDNGGVTLARNTGLDALLPQTQYVTFLDSDDLMAPDRFVRDLPILIENPDLGLTYGDMVITFALDRKNLTVPHDAKQQRLTSIHLASCLYRRNLIDRIGRFDESLKMAEDTDYIFRTFEIGISFRQTDTICHYYLRHPGNMSSKLRDNQIWFARAILRSVQRRRDDPTRTLVKPTFSIELQKDFFVS